VEGAAALMTRGAAVLLALLPLLPACGEDERPCQQDTDCASDERCDPRTQICVARAGLPDLGGATDLAPPLDGPWSCGTAVQGGGAVACTYTWSCSDGKRKLSCEYDVVDNVFDCTCHDLARKRVDGTFEGPSQTCASGAATVRAQANKACTWKVP
jgi:hypothetical protein